MALVAVTSPQSASQDNRGLGPDAAGAHFRSEEKGPDGKVRGEYGFRTPNGCLHVVSYEAQTRGGYRILGTSRRDCRTAQGSPSPSVTKPSPPPPTINLPKTAPTTTTTTSTTTKPFIFTTTTTSTTTTPRRSAVVTPGTTTGPLFVGPLPVVVDNTVTEPKAVEEESQGRQLFLPNPTTPTVRPKTTTTTTPQPLSLPQTQAEKNPIYSFGYTAPGHGHSQSGGADGSKKGEYYTDYDNGWRVIVTYVANDKGFYPRIRRIRIPSATPSPEGKGKDLGPEPEVEIAVPVGGCPYYFYYNTKINFHWERCHENGTRTGEYGRLAPDGYVHKTWYYADSTGFHPTLSKTPMTEEQRETMAEYMKGAFIIPKVDEERKDTERRIQEWLKNNQDRVNNPLRR